MDDVFPYPARLQHLQMAVGFHGNADVKLTAAGGPVGINLFRHTGL
ncbi:hypothetical protein V474_23800 [Novosphingobium barchaimii LL02]|uniref:Uncharacterized protein n=1 Tax=Novosphingobium barchaimii LL02 TaxID=1114963 RepID=A0A0J8ACU2_9SPHN|nr:hypothetical protein V474_23800 [Novosphingobium barchaimii LL02]